MLSYFFANRSNICMPYCGKMLRFFYKPKVMEDTVLKKYNLCKIARLKTK